MVFILSFKKSIIISLYLVSHVINSLKATEKLAVFGYLPEYRKTNFDYAGVFTSGLTHLIFFSVEVDKSTFLPKALDRLPSIDEVSYARAAADNVNGKLILGFGGHSRSEGFAEMTQVKSRRVKFLNALKSILEDYDLV